LALTPSSASPTRCWGFQPKRCQEKRGGRGYRCAGCQLAYARFWSMAWWSGGATNDIQRSYQRWLQLRLMVLCFATC
jgi:hypothetical protein